MGDVIVRLTVNKKKGTYEAKVIGHEGGSSCGDELDESIVEDLLNAEIPGYGQLVNPVDSGHTDEYFDEKQAKQKPRAYHDYDDDDDDECDGGEKSGKKLDLGYGV